MGGVRRKGVKVPPLLRENNHVGLHHLQSVLHDSDRLSDHLDVVQVGLNGQSDACLLYTSDAADERSSVDLGGRRIIKKKTPDEYT